jgi:8-oxo-dGTP pyrophosphatase MutT (NUDIX family)
MEVCSVEAELLVVAVVVVKENKVLLLWHKTFQRLQQPGGHIDQPDQNVFEAAIREVKEETGLDVERDKDFANGIFSEVPVSIDKHAIAQNEKKQESAHYHFDMFFYLKLKVENQEIKNEDAGTENAQWVEIEKINSHYNRATYKAIENLKKYI